MGQGTRQCECEETDDKRVRDTLPLEARMNFPRPHSNVVCSSHYRDHRRAGRLIKDEREASNDDITAESDAQLLMLPQAVLPEERAQLVEAWLLGLFSALDCREMKGQRMGRYTNLRAR